MLIIFHVPYSRYLHRQKYDIISNRTEYRTEN